MYQIVVNQLAVLGLLLNSVLPIVTSVKRFEENKGVRGVAPVEIRVNTTQSDYQSLSPDIQGLVGTGAFYNSLSLAQQERVVHIATHFLSLHPYISTTSPQPEITITREQAVSMGIAGDVYDLIAEILAPEENSGMVQSECSSDSGVLVGGTAVTDATYCANKKKLMKRIAAFFLAAGVTSGTAGAWCHLLGGITPLQLGCFVLDILGIANAGIAGLVALYEEQDPSVQVCFEI